MNIPKKILRIIGARPQFMQAACLHKQLVKSGYQEVLLHTGQHYDDNMSRIFFEQLHLPPPDIELGIGSHSHGIQLGKMLSKLDALIDPTEFGCVLVDGDTNSTLAGALFAAKIHVPLVHIEAGLRSFDKRMPEEINRITTDHISDLLCAPTRHALSNLQKEGLESRAVLTGDLMYDCYLQYKNKADRLLLKELGFANQPFVLATLHRQENTHHIQVLKGLMNALNALPLKVLFPLHPRTELMLKTHDIHYFLQYSNIIFIPAVGYLQMLGLLQNASFVFTDSGGLQREAYFARIPSVILRDTTEWQEIISVGWSVIGGVETEQILQTFDHFRKSTFTESALAFFGEGQAAENITKAIRTFIS